jgi:hypothetical protein
MFPPFFYPSLSDQNILIDPAVTLNVGETSTAGIDNFFPKGPFKTGDFYKEPFSQLENPRTKELPLLLRFPPWIGKISRFKTVFFHGKN